MLDMLIRLIHAQHACQRVCSHTKSHATACVRASVSLELSVHHQETVILEVNAFKVSICHRRGWIKVPNVESLARI